MKTILITGANRGIGLEFVKQYARAGYNVIATCRQPSEADELNSLASTDKSSITVKQLDVLNHQQIDNLASSIDDPIDVLINNSGVYGPKYSPLSEVNESDWLDVLKVNTIAPLYVARAFAGHLANGTEKKLAVLSSKMGSMEDNGSGGSYIYRSSKAALNAVLKSLSIDLAEQSIKVISLHPGWVKTDMGGPNALITTTESVNGMKEVIDNLTKSQSGQFINFDGTPIPW